MRKKTNPKAVSSIVKNKKTKLKLTGNFKFGKTCTRKCVKERENVMV